MTENNNSKGRQIKVRAVRRNPPDMKKLSRALIALAMAQAQEEVDAQAQHEADKKKDEGPSRAA